jgi:hypothetical protein
VISAIGEFHCADTILHKAGLVPALSKYEYVFQSQVASVCVSHGKLISYLATQKSVVEKVEFHGTGINHVGQSSIHVDHTRLYHVSHVIVVLATVVVFFNTTVSVIAIFSSSVVFDNNACIIQLFSKLEPEYAVAIALYTSNLIVSNESLFIVPLYTDKFRFTKAPVFETTFQ